MSRLPLLLLTHLEELFFDEMGRQTSACLYGSGASNDWVATRSDLDLLIRITEGQLPSLRQQIYAWNSVRTYPLLDGFAIFFSGGELMAKPLDQFEEDARPITRLISSIDLWNIKNRSRHLFGQDFREEFPDYTILELQNWALRNIREYWIPLLNGGVSVSQLAPETQIPRKYVVWTASGVARMLMLAQGSVCSSKREAIAWLANTCPEIRDVMGVLSENFEKSDEEARTFNAQQTGELGTVYLRLLRAASNLEPAGIT